MHGHSQSSGIDPSALNQLAIALRVQSAHIDPTDLPISLSAPAAQMTVRLYLNLVYLIGAPHPDPNKDSFRMIYFGTPLLLTKSQFSVFFIMAASRWLVHMLPAYHSYFESTWIDPNRLAVAFNIDPIRIIAEIDQIFSSHISHTPPKFFTWNDNNFVQLRMAPQNILIDWNICSFFPDETVTTISKSVYQHLTGHDPSIELSLFHN